MAGGGVFKLQRASQGIEPDLKGLAQQLVGLGLVGESRTPREAEPLQIYSGCESWGM